MAQNAEIISRIVAVIIDTIIVGVVAFILALPFGVLAMLNPMAYANPMLAAQVAAASLAVSGLSLLIFVGYYTYFEGTTGQTIGKKIVNIKVVKENGKPMTYMDSLVRTILRVVDGIGFYLIGFIVILASEKKQRIGDMAARTLVVKA
jgi:uncharacterized RDD family membrane protein YckC